MSLSIVVCDFDETLIAKGVKKITDIIAHGTVVNFIIPIMTLEYIRSRACIAELELALIKNLDISNLGSTIPIVYDRRLRVPGNLPPILLNCPVENIFKDEFIDFKKKQLDALQNNAGKVAFDKLDRLKNRIMIAPLAENRLRFDHTFWDMYESFLDMDRRFVIEATQDGIRISAKSQDRRIQSDIPLTFYGPLDLRGYSKLVLAVEDVSNCKFDAWGDKMIKIVFNNLPLIANNEYVRSEGAEYVTQVNGQIEYDLPQSNSAFNKICIVIAPGLIDRFRFGIFFK